MTPPQADRVPGAGLKIQSKIKQFELLHPVPITLANISMAVIVAAATIIESYFRSLGAWILTLHLRNSILKRALRAQ